MTEDEERTLLLVSAGVGEPSSTTTLATQIGAAAKKELMAAGLDVRVSILPIRDLASDLGVFNATGRKSQHLEDAMEQISRADALVVATPVYKGGMSGLFKSFWDAAPDDVVAGKPVVLAATAGTPRHSLVPDSHMRELFAYLRALSTPTSVFAATEDLASPGTLQKRVDRAAGEVALLMSLGADRQLRQAAQAVRSKDGHRGQQGMDAGSGFDLDTDLMRLATGQRVP